MKNSKNIGLALLAGVGVAMLNAQDFTGPSPRALTLADALDLALLQNPDVAGKRKAGWRKSAARLEAARSRGGQRAEPAAQRLRCWTEDQRLMPATRNGDRGVFGANAGGGSWLPACRFIPAAASPARRMRQRGAAKNRGSVDACARVARLSGDGHVLWLAGTG